MRLRILPLGCVTVLLLSSCGRKERPASSTTPGAPEAVAATAAPAAAAPVKLDPPTLITQAEAEAILGEPVTFENEAMPAYQGAVGFNYHTKGLHYLSAAVYPDDGPGMYQNMKRDLPGAGKLSETPCSGVGQECLFSGRGPGVGMLHAVKGNFYFTLSADAVKPAERKRVYEELGSKVASRLP